MKFYVGGYSKNGPGIALAETDGSTASFRPLPCDVADPSWILPNRAQTVLYTVGEDEKDGTVAAFDIAEDGSLIKRSERKAGGGSPCHLCLSEDERFLYCANYMTGSISVFPVNGSEILPRIQLEEHGEGAHAHSTVLNPEDRRAYVCDLGLDAIFVYDRDTETGLLTESERLALPKGAGPRHLLFDGGNRMYAACELQSLLVYFERTNGCWNRKQVISTLPDNFSGTSSVSAVRLDGCCVYVGNRGHDSVAKFRINADGTVRKPEFLPTGASFPRDFRVFDGSVYACCQFGGCVTRDGKRLFDMSGVSCITEQLK